MIEIEERFERMARATARFVKRMERETEMLNRKIDRERKKTDLNDREMKVLLLRGYGR